MRSPPFLLFALLLGGSASCTVLGGGEDLSGGTPATFTITSRTPSGGSAGIPVITTIVVNFSSTIDTASITPGVLTLNDVSVGSFVIEGSKLAFTPASGLEPGSSYAVAVSPDIRGINGLHLGVVSPWGFKTAGTPPPPPDTVTLSRPRRK